MNLETGDLLLFSGQNTGFFSYFSSLVKYGTHSNYSHVGMVLKDPTFISPSLKGLYVWESGWEGTNDPQDGNIKLGVQITPLYEMMKQYEGGKVLCRKIVTKDNVFSNENLKEVHDEVYNKPYDINIFHWLQGLLGKDFNKQRTDCFWCSALVGYIYTKCGLLDKNTDWSILRPSDFSIVGEKLKFNDGYYLENTERLL